MVMDYRERKPVSKNRPRKQPLGVFFFIVIIAISISFVAGVATGWLIFRPTRSKLAGVQQQGVTPDQPGQASATTGQPQNPEAQSTGEPPLTFYETLPKGSRAVIGSGLNPSSNAPAFTAKPATPPQAPRAVQTEQPAVPEPVPPAQPAVKIPMVAKPKDGKEMADQPKPATKSKASTLSPVVPNKTSPSKGTFSVQVASQKDRKEAEAVRDRLVARGMAAYIVESHLPDKGVWYRVRVGRGLEQRAASELAAKAGKGAITIPE
ncbi:MAG: SPOR domain-containing protein [Geobacter sp.]|nr:MAG: SPOR domain-containing protein [Geobacter sp.]